VEPLRKAFEDRRRLFWLYALVALVADLATKAILWHHPDEGRQVVDIIPGCLRLIPHPGNPQGAWGLGPSSPIFFVATAILGLGVIGWLLMATPAGKGLVHAGLGLLAGGAAGNLYDRLVRPSHTVRDFIEMYWGKARWPAYNIADAAICIGFALVFIDAFLRRERPAEAAAGERPADEAP